MRALAPRPVGAPRPGVGLYFGPAGSSAPNDLQRRQQLLQFAANAVGLHTLAGNTSAITLARAAITGSKIPGAIQTGLGNDLTTAGNGANSKTLAQQSSKIAAVLHLIGQWLNAQPAGAVRIAGLPRVGMGALNTSDATLASTTSTLAQDLASNGCQQSAQSDVSAFQSAYNNAGGSPTLTVDGLYGANTAGALTAVFAAGVDSPLNVSIPAGCVAAASSSSSTPAATDSGGTSVSVDNSTDLIPLALAGVAGLGLIGWAIYAKKKGHVLYRRRPVHRHS
jgi:hypothetical protein